MTATPAGFTSIPFGDVEAGQEFVSEISLDLRGIVPGSYYLGCEFHEIDSAGTAIWHDYIENMLQIEILENHTVRPGLPDHTSKIPWNHNSWGCLRLEAGMEEIR
jgi:5-methylcytosine-specific restriction endonuclease McrBC regulatory subunit McrC